MAPVRPFLMPAAALALVAAPAGQGSQESFFRNLEAVKAFARTQPNGSLGAINRDGAPGNNMGRWVLQQRKLHVQGRLTREQSAALADVCGLGGARRSRVPAPAPAPPAPPAPFHYPHPLPAAGGPAAMDLDHAPLAVPTVPVYDWMVPEDQIRFE